MYRARNAIAAIVRALPGYRGKGRLGQWVGPRLTDSKNDRSCITTIRLRNGLLMTLDVRSDTEFWPYWTGCFDDSLIKRMGEALGPTATVLDVGANIGFWSLPLAQRLQTLGGKLYSFEPIQANFERLLDNVRRNGLEAGFHGFNVALGDREGEIEMSMTAAPGAATGNAIIINSETSKHYPSNNRARITQLDRFAEEEHLDRCDFVKVDIEGAEILFLRGGKTFLSRHRPFIYGEFSAVHLRHFGACLVEISEILVDYQAYRLDGERFVAFDLHEEGVENVLLLPKETVGNEAIQRLLG